MAFSRITAHFFIGKYVIGNVWIKAFVPYASKLSLYCGRPAYPALGRIPFNQDTGISKYPICDTSICVHIISTNLSIGIWHKQFWNWA